MPKTNRFPALQPYFSQQKQPHCKPEGAEESEFDGGSGKRGAEQDSGHKAEENPGG